jgi:hypothetical protein
MLDILTNDAFSTANLTAAINLLPYQPRRLGQMGLFEIKNPRQHTVIIERKDGRLAILESKPRSSGETTKNPSSRRDMVPIMIPYIPLDDVVTAESLQGVREMGTEDQLETVTAAVNEKMTTIRARHEMTHEWHRLGAIKGKILDGDSGMSELLDLFEVFDVTQEEIGFDIASGAGAGFKVACAEAIGLIEEGLGGMTYDHVHAIVGNEFFQQLVNSPAVVSAYTANYGPAATDFLAKQQSPYGTQGRGTNQVWFGDILWENYRGKIGSTPFIETDEAHLFPVGVPGLFQTHFGPANTISAVNKPGEPITVMQQMLKWEAGIELHSESNPLCICTMPELLIHGYSSNS